MPDGNILRTGALGSGDGWFFGEGPGPSLRALIRGGLGHQGGLGVFTKCALKVYPWPGPAVMPVEGTVPAYNSPLPDNIRAYTPALTSWKTYADTFYKIYDAEIGYIAHRQFPKLGEDPPLAATLTSFGRRPSPKRPWCCTSRRSTTKGTLARWGSGRKPCPARRTQERRFAKRTSGC